MPRIVLATINARYAHTAFGLRYLAANLGDLTDDADILEFTLDQRPADIAEQILARDPVIVGIGVYIWNAEASRELVSILASVAPHVTVIVGGPEVSHEEDRQAITAVADHVVQGEGEEVFSRLCASILAGRDVQGRIHPGGLPCLETMRSPYGLYTDEDIERRVIYVEASRGCPYRCEFCLSSLDEKVRAFPLQPFLEDMQELLDRGARHFKFVDRTFNLDLRRSSAILEFFLARYEPGLFLHFEMVPDRLPENLRDAIRRFPPGSLQFEVGIQSLDEDVGRRIQRRQDTAKTLDNLRFLREQTGVHLHTDLLIGLPGDTVDQFGESLDTLMSLDVHEVQIGILKRLRGAPIDRHDAKHAMRYSPTAPYEILSTDCIDFATMQRMKRFSLTWNTVVNRGNFRTTAKSLFAPSPFAGVLDFTDWLFARAGRVHSISLHNMAAHLFEFLVEERGGAADAVAASIHADFEAAGRTLPRHLPAFARHTATGGTALRDTQRKRRPADAPKGLPPRQSRHHTRPESGPTDAAPAASVDTEQRP